MDGLVENLNNSRLMSRRQMLSAGLWSLATGVLAACETADGSCLPTETGCGGGAGPTDVVKPTVRLLDPEEVVTKVGDSVSTRVQATDNESLSKIIYDWGPGEESRDVATSSAEEVFTRAFEAPGEYQTAARAVDQAGNTSEPAIRRVVVNPRYVEATLAWTHLFSGAPLHDGVIRVVGGPTLELAGGRTVISANNALAPGEYQLTITGPNFHDQYRSIVLRDGEFELNVVDADFDIEKHNEFLGRKTYGPENKDKVSRWNKAPKVVIYDRTVFRLNDAGNAPAVMDGTEEELAQLRLSTEDVENILSIWREDVPSYTPFVDLEIVLESQADPDDVPDFTTWTQGGMMGWIAYGPYNDTPDSQKISAVARIQDHEIVRGFNLSNPRFDISRGAWAVDTNQTLGWDNQGIDEQVLEPGVVGRPLPFLKQSGVLMYGRPLGSGPVSVDGVYFPDGVALSQ